MAARPACRSRVATSARVASGEEHGEQALAYRSGGESEAEDCGGGREEHERRARAKRQRGVE